MGEPESTITTEIYSVKTSNGRYEKIIPLPH